MSGLLWFLLITPFLSVLLLLCVVKFIKLFKELQEDELDVALWRIERNREEDRRKWNTRH